MPAILHSTDNISQYADDPNGYMSNGHTARGERAKQWAVALSRHGKTRPHDEDDEESGQAEFEPWIFKPPVVEEPRNCTYRVKKHTLGFFASKRWDLFYLRFLFGTLILIPLQFSGLVGDSLKESVVQICGFLFLGMFLFSLIPALAGFFFRRFCCAFLRSRGREERTQWNVSFVLALRSLANPPHAWYQALPRLESWIRACIPSVCRFLPCSIRLAEIRVAFNNRVIVPFVNTLAPILCPRCLCGGSAVVKPGAGVDFSPPEGMEMERPSRRSRSRGSSGGYSDKEGEGEESKEHCRPTTPVDQESEGPVLATGSLDVREEAAPAGSGDGDVAENAQDKPLSALDSPSSKPALDEGERAGNPPESPAGGSSDSRGEEGTREPPAAAMDPAAVVGNQVGAQSDGSQESVAQEEGEEDLEDPKEAVITSVRSSHSRSVEDEVSFANTDTDSEMISFAPTDTESEVSLSHLDDIPEADEEAFGNPFAMRSTKIVIEEPELMPHEERNALPIQSIRDAAPPSFEEQIVPFDSDQLISWECRTCGRWNREPLNPSEKSKISMKVSKKVVPGTKITQYRALLEVREKVQSCRVCGTPYNYEPSGQARKFFFQGKGDNSSSVFHKKLAADKAAARLGNSTRPASQGGRKRKRATIRSGKPEPKPYLSSHAQIQEEVAASKRLGYRPFNVRKSKPPWRAESSKDGSSGIDEGQEEEEGEEGGEDREEAEPSPGDLEEGTMPRRQRRGGVMSSPAFQPGSAASPGRRAAAQKLNIVQVQAGALKHTMGAMKDSMATNGSVQLLVNAFRDANAAYHLAKVRSKKAVDKRDLIFNDYRMKERERDFKPEFERTTGPDIDEGQYWPLHSVIESIAHNPSWTPGIITRVHENNTYDIRFDNGTDAQCVEYYQIRFRLRSRVSLIMQALSAAGLLLVTVSPLIGFVHQVTKGTTKANGRDDDVEFDDAVEIPSERGADGSMAALVLPGILAGLAGFFIPAFQLLALYVSNTKEAGLWMHFKFLLFFAGPGLAILISSLMLLEKLNDHEGGEPWIICFAPWALSSAMLSCIMNLVKPLYGTFLSIAGFLWVLFLLGLGAYLDFPDVLPEVYIFIVFAPLYILAILVFRAYRHLPYVWDAEFGNGLDVEPDLAARLATQRRNETK